jgi:hypothetical protein
MSEVLDKSRGPRAATSPIRPAKPATPPLVHVTNPTIDESHVESRRAAESQSNERRLGSKANEATWKKIINQMPPHHTYIEPFLGWGAIMLHKAPANHSICIDREEEKAINFLLELATAYPTMGSGIVSSDEELWQRVALGRRKPTCRTLPPQLQGAAARGLATIGEPDEQISRLLDSGPWQWASTKENPTCAVIVGNALAFLASYPWRGDELVYCDPPYMHETRSSRHRYLFEMGTLEHQALLDILKQIPAKVMLSGYASELYSTALKDWRLVTFEAITRGGTMRTEHLWCNFPEPVELHDYRYLGRNFRERQDLNRMRKRWIAKLRKMPILKQRALFAAMKEFHEQR